VCVCVYVWVFDNCVSVLVICVFRLLSVTSSDGVSIAILHLLVDQVVIFHIRIRHDDGQMRDRWSDKSAVKLTDVLRFRPTSNGGASDSSAWVGGLHNENNTLYSTTKTCIY
jgi:hypothetical protein